MVKEKFKEIKNCTAADHVIYNILRSYPPKRGFNPITKPVKLENGQRPYRSFEEAVSSIRFDIRYNRGFFSKERFGIDFSKQLILDALDKEI